MQDSHSIILINSFLFFIVSVYNNKANISHTHNDYTATTTVPCEYGTVRKFKKNGWVMVIWEGIDISSIPKGTWTVLADIGWSNQTGSKYLGNFQTQLIDTDRFSVNDNGQLRAWRERESTTAGYWGYIVYPTSD